MVSSTRNLTILFADISGSTKLYELLGNEEARSIVDRCLAIAMRVCEDFGGRVVKTIGDEVMAAFSTTDSAAQAAIEIQMRVSKQRTSRGAAIAMHIGFHSGPAIEEDNDVFGDCVNVAARMTALGSRGQIFTSAHTASELSQVLRQRTRDQDKQTLKGKEQDIGLFELLWDAAEDELTAMSPRLARTPAKVTLVHGARQIDLGEERPLLTLGRDAQNDVVIGDMQVT